jgi:transposase
MRHRDDTRKDSAEKAVRDIRRATRRRFAAEEKIRIVVEGLRGEDSIADWIVRYSLSFIYHVAFTFRR